MSLNIVMLYCDIVPLHPTSDGAVQPRVGVLSDVNVLFTGVCPLGMFGQLLSFKNVFVLSVLFSYPSYILPYNVCVAVLVQKFSTVNVQLLSAAPAVLLHTLFNPLPLPVLSIIVSESKSAAPLLVTVTVPVLIHAGLMLIAVIVDAVLFIILVFVSVFVVDVVYPSFS